jgi:hypothetical protein
MGNLGMRRLCLTGILALLFSGLLLIPGCSKNTVAPTPLPVVDGLSQQKVSWLNQNFAPSVPGGPLKGSPIDELPILKDTVLAAWVDHEGDELEFKDDNGKLIFKIQSNALKNYTRIVIHLTKYEASFGPFWILDCGPSGTVFAKPLQVKSEGDFGKTKILYYFNEKTEEWEVDEIAGESKPLEINHFSKYAISK